MDFGPLYTAIVALAAAITFLFRELMKLSEKERSCARKMAVFEVKLAYVERDLALAKHADPSRMPPSFVTARFPGARITEVSEDISGLLGYSSQELIGQSAERLVPPALLEQFREASRRCAEADRLSMESMVLSTEAAHKDGRLIPVLVSLREVSHQPLTVRAQIIYRKV